jgi:hypothetical protein
LPTLAATAAATLASGPLPVGRRLTSSFLLRLSGGGRLGTPIAVAVAFTALLRRLRTLAPLLLLFVVASFAPLLLRSLALRLRPGVGARRATAVATLLILALASRLLLEFLDLTGHELPRLGVLLRAELVVSAVRTALPSLGIGSLAGGAENAFRERHCESVAHCTLPPCRQPMPRNGGRH